MPGCNQGFYKQCLNFYFTNHIDCYRKQPCVILSHTWQLCTVLGLQVLLVLGYSLLVVCKQVLLVLGYRLLVVCKQPELWRVRTPHMVAYSPHTNTVVLETVATVASNTVLLT